MQFRVGSRSDAAPRRLHTHGVFPLLGIMACTVFGITGCVQTGRPADGDSSSSSISRDGFANSAVLHPDTGIVDLPLDRYEIDDPEYTALSLHARDAVTNSCLAEHHLAAVSDPLGWKPGPRPFAWYPMIWSVQLAQKYGFETPNPPTSADPYDSYSTAKQKQLVSCEQKGRDAMDERAATAPMSRTYASLIEQARSATIADDVGKAALADIAQCLKGKHVQVDPETGLHGRATDVMPLAQQIPVAVAEATCATETGGAQKYFDVLAQYQASLIEQNKDALEEGIEGQRAAKQELRVFIETEEHKK